jgi:hypothetical protein
VEECVFHIDWLGLNRGEAIAMEEEWEEKETPWNKIQYGKSDGEISSISYMSKFLIEEATISFEEITRE